MNLVTDGDRFAIRKHSEFWDGYVYFGLYHGYWWHSKECVKQYCWGDEKRARKVFEYLNRRNNRKEWVVE